MTSKTFCILPWIHMYVNADGTVLPCCIADHNLPLGSTYTHSTTDIWNNDFYKNIRKNMLTGKQCNECKACYRNEDSGIKSFRQEINQRFSHHMDLIDSTDEDGTLNLMSLKYFDVRWSNICNFKCRSCSSTYSSSWATEDNSLGYNKKVYIFAGGNNNDNLYDQFKPHFAHIEEFYFAGGEPLLTDKHYEILNYLIDNNRTDVRLRYNTNLSNLNYKNQSIIDLWSKFKNVNVYVSLDSWGDRAEYIREGTDWNKLKTNIIKIKEILPHVNLQMSTVISIFNVSTILDFINYLRNEKLFLENNFYPSFYNIMNPGYYSFSILTDNEKEKIIKKLQSRNYNSYINGSIDNIIEVLKNSEYNDQLRKKFISQTKLYDSIRNRNFEKTFPELEFLL